MKSLVETLLIDFSFLIFYLGTALPLLVTGSVAASFVASLSAANMLGRFGWAFLSDYSGRKLGTYLVENFCTELRVTRVISVHPEVGPSLVMGYPKTSSRSLIALQMNLILKIFTN